MQGAGGLKEVPVGTYLREVLDDTCLGEVLDDTCLGEVLDGAYPGEVLDRRYEVAYSLGKHLVREFLVSTNRRRLAGKSYLR